MNLLVPPRPVMVHIMAPIVNPCRNALALQQILEQTGLMKHLVFISSLSDTEDDIAAAVLTQIMLITQAGQVMERRIEVDVLAHIVAEEIIGGIDAAQGN
ncbi:hypothetical protein D3C81_1823010 [compost metagenome]